MQIEYKKKIKLFVDDDQIVHDDQSISISKDRKFLIGLVIFINWILQGLESVQVAATERWP